MEIELARSDDHLTRLRHILQGLEPNDLFEYCILDTPPSLGVLMTSPPSPPPMKMSSSSPMRVGLALEGLAKIVHVIDQIRGSDANPDIRLEGIVMTALYDRPHAAFPSGRGRGFQVFPGSDVPQHDPAHHPHRRGNAAMARASSSTIPSASAQQAYGALADEFLTRHAAVGPQLAGAAGNF